MNRKTGDKFDSKYIMITPMYMIHGGLSVALTAESNSDALRHCWKEALRNKIALRVAK